MTVSSAIGGFAGACALTIINESVKKIDKNAPRLDLLGMNALARMLNKGGKLTPTPVRKLMPASLMGDLISNSLYFGLAAGSSKKLTLMRGALLGVGAGIGALTLPEPMDLPKAPTTRTKKTKILTVAWYLLGGLVAAAAINAIQDSRTS